MSTLREQMLADLQLKGLTPKTQKIYLREVRNYAKYFGKSPEQLGEKELREYLLYLLMVLDLAEVKTFAFRHGEYQAPGDSNDYLFCWSQDKRNGTP
jgi:hypothetical protein